MSMFPIPVNGELAVCNVRLWHSTQPIPGLPTLAPKSCEPRACEAVYDATGSGVGAALSLMKAAKLTVSEDIWLAVPVVLPLEVVRLVESSGVGLKTQPGTAERSLPKTSLATPCSTLYASPAKMSSDLFCAFHPKRVIVPSFPAVLNFPKIPRLCFRLAPDARFACRAESGTFSISPRPKVGVG